MNVKPILCLPLTASATAVRKGEEAGYCVIQLRDPAKAVVRMPTLSQIAGHDLLMAALHGVKQSSQAEMGMVRDLTRRLEARENADATQRVPAMNAGGAS